MVQSLLETGTRVSEFVALRVETDSLDERSICLATLRGELVAGLLEGDPTTVVRARTSLSNGHD